MKYRILFTKQAEKDLDKIAESEFKQKAYRLLTILEENPLNPPLEKLVGFQNVYSRRINIQHRLVYRIEEESQCVVILRMWTHYGDN